MKEVPSLCTTPPPPWRERTVFTYIRTVKNVWTYNHASRWTNIRSIVLTWIGWSDGTATDDQMEQRLRDITLKLELLRYRTRLQTSPLRFNDATWSAIYSLILEHWQERLEDDYARTTYATITVSLFNSLSKSGFFSGNIAGNSNRSACLWRNLYGLKSERWNSLSVEEKGKE